MNKERAARGAETINRYLAGQIDDAPGDAAVDAIADILHAYCQDDELEAETVLSRAKMHFLAEIDEEERYPDASNPDR